MRPRRVAAIAVVLTIVHAVTTWATILGSGPTTAHDAERSIIENVCFASSSVLLEPMTSLLMPSTAHFPEWKAFVAIGINSLVWGLVLSLFIAAIISVRSRVRAAV